MFVFNLCTFYLYILMCVPNFKFHVYQIHKVAFKFRLYVCVCVCVHAMEHNTIRLRCRYSLVKTMVAMNCSFSLSSIGVADSDLAHASMIYPQGIQNHKYLQERLGKK